MPDNFNLIPAVLTPMDSAGNLNLATVPPYVERLVDNGITSAFVAGSTGECMSLSTDERKKVAEAWMNDGGDQLEIIVHVGHSALPEVVDLAAHAGQIGAHGIAALSPHYIQPANEDDLIDCLEVMANAAPKTPFYYYHIPSLTRMELDILTFLEKCIERIPTFTGIKYTHEDLIEFAQCVDQFGDRLKIFFGRDEMLLHGLTVGATGAVGSMYSLKSKLFQDLIEAFQVGDSVRAKELSKESQEFVQTMIDFGVMPGAKALLTHEGVDCGPVRLPLKPLDDEQMVALLKRIG